MELEGYEPLKNFEDQYMICKEGHIWNIKRNKIMRPQKKVYLSIALWKEGKYYYTTIHRLLGIQYLPNPNNLPEIDHIDRDRYNNSLENLRWITRLDNMRNKDCYVGYENWKEYKRDYDKKYRLENRERILEKEAIYRKKKKEIQLLK